MDDRTIVTRFFEYLGNEESLQGYSRSYKLVFYKSFFGLIDANGEAYAYKVSEKFKDFYVNRVNSGKVADKDVDERIANISSSSVKQVYDVILSNPYKHINEKGFIQKKTNEDGKDVFFLPEDLHNQLTEEDISEVKRIVDKKIDLYYSRIDTVTDNLTRVISTMLYDYTQATESSFAGHPIGTFFRNDIPRLIFETGIIRPEEYLVKGSVGQGNWATIPWVCIFDKSITSSATKGVYIVFLLSSDGQSVYLTFNQGCTEISKTHSKRETTQILRYTANELQANLDSRGFNSDENIHLGDNLPTLGYYYEKGTIFYKEYKRDQIPSEDVLRDDLEKLIFIYKDYVHYLHSGEDHIGNNEQQEGEKSMTTKATVEHVKQYIASKGFSYPDGLIENFYLSLKSKPFVILAGTSGTGKTRLVKLFSEAIGAKMQLTPVRPDWSDSTDLFGYVNLNGKFIPGAVTDFLFDAHSHPETSYILCLDEMNLARVEYYLSDILSIIETREFADNRIITDPLLSEKNYKEDTNALAQYGKIIFPDNLYLVGTVNMDETTFPFSKKVLDRANTIEFSYVDLIPDFATIDNGIESLDQNNEFLKTNYLLLTQCQEDAAYVSQICVELKAINDVLTVGNANVGYRVRDEIVFYVLNNKKLGLLPENTAMDNEIMQKILPRIQGSSMTVKNMLCELFKICAGDYKGYQTANDSLADELLKVTKERDCKYIQSAKKIAFMVRRFEEDGFTSYWL